MGKVFDEIDDKLAAWIKRQRMFFVGTAPSGGDGHVNVSPKGPIESLRILGPRRVGYVDLIGSGAETAAHVCENGRIVIMLCAFEGPPRIVRLHGRGDVVQIGEPGFTQLKAQFDLDSVQAAEAARAIVVVEIDRVADSCGYGVPLIEPSPPGEVQGFDADVAMVAGTFDPDDVYGRFPAGVPARLESSLARAERKRGISVPELPCPSLVIYGDEFGDERGTPIASLYGSEERDFPGLDHWDLVRNSRVREAIADYLGAFRPVSSA